MLEEGREHRGGPAVRLHAPIPAAQELQGRPHVGSGGRGGLVGLENARGLLPGGDPEDVQLHAGHVLGGKALLRRDQFPDAQDAVPGLPIGRNVERPRGWEGGIVGRGGESFRGVEDLGHFLEGHEALPLVQPVPADAEPVSGIPRAQLGNPPGRLQADVPVPPGEGDVLPRSPKTAQGLAEFPPIAGAVESMDSVQFVGVFRHRIHPLIGKNLIRLLQQFADDGSVGGLPHLQYLGFAALDADYFCAGFHRHPLPLVHHLLRVVGMQFLHEEIPRVRHQVGEPPGDIPIASDGHERRSGKNHAGHVQGRGFQVRLEPDGRQTQGQVGVVGQDGGAGCAFCGPHHPCIARFEAGKPRQQRFLLRREPQRGRDLQGGKPSQSGNGGKHCGLPPQGMGENLGGSLPPHLVHDPLIEPVHLPGRVEVPGHEANHGGQFRNGHGLPTDPQQGVFDGQGAAQGRRGGVHAIAVGFQGLAHLRFRGGGHAPGVSGNIYGAEQSVHLDHIRSHHFRQASVGHTAHQVHLEQPLLGHGPSQGKIGVPVTACEDVRDSPAVPDDFHRVGDSRGHRIPLHIRQRPPPEIEPGADGDSYNQHKYGQDDEQNAFHGETGKA